MPNLDHCDANPFGSAHCAHRTGYSKPINPPIYIMVCCWCGRKGDMRGEIKQPKGHGHYVPDATIYNPRNIQWTDNQ
jgi:hypothetical protein